jgi:hypothetical protein
VKERPILSSAPMVRALLAGTKTQTRRVVKCNSQIAAVGTAADWSRHKAHPAMQDPRIVLIGEDGMPFSIPCPYGQPGDRLWVREAHALQNRYKNVWCTYAADGEHKIVPAPALVNVARPGLHPSIHMPRWASRILLEVTEVRIERLQEISEDDAIAEGVERAGERFKGYLPLVHDGKVHDLALAKSSYSQLWEFINGPGSWQANPWVWVVEFKRLDPQ